MQSESRIHKLDLPGDGTSIRVLAVMPSRPSKRAVLVLHEKRGLDDHTTHIARKLADHGLTAFCPDLLSRFGHAQSGSVPTARGIPTDWLVADATAVARQVADMYSLDSLGGLGFSFGGEVAARMALASQHLDVLVAYYSHLSRVPWHDLAIPTLAIFAGTDDQIERVGELREQDSDDGHVLEVHSLPAPRAFEDPHRPDRYDAQSAAQAWSLTLDWFDEHLSAAASKKEDH